jgi:YVTN family beta-propeller protein
VLLLAAVVLVLAAGGPVPKPKVFRVPGGPSSLVSSAGRVWVAAPRAGRLVALEGGVAISVPTGGAPTRLAAGANGLWAADTAAGTVIPIQSRPALALAPVKVGPRASDVALAAGSLFVAGAADGRVYVRSPSAQSAVITGHSPVALASDGQRVLVADSRDGTLTVIDARHVIRTIRIGGTLVDVAAAGDFAWVVDATDGDAIEVDLASGRVDRDIAVGRRPVAVAVAGADTYVLSDRGLLRIRGDAVESTRAAGPAPTALAVDDNYVWVASGDTVLRFNR